MLRSEDGQSWFGVVAACAAAGMLGGDVLAQSTAPQSPAVVKTVQVKPGELSGKIVHGGTRAAVDNHSMALRDSTGRVVSRVATGADGSYTTPPLPEGNYVLQVTDELSLGLDVTPNASIQTLDLVVPAEMMPDESAEPQSPQTSPNAPDTVPPAPGGAAPAAPAAPSPAAAGLGVVGWGLIGTGAAAAVAVPVGLAVSDSGSSKKNENTVSSASSRAR